MPLYTFINQTKFRVHLPFAEGVDIGPQGYATLSLPAHNVDIPEVQTLIQKKFIRVSVENDLARDDEIEVFPGPHPAGGEFLLPPSATDPVGAAGSQYYNTVINEYLYFDAFRSKWLTKSSEPFQVGRNGNNFAGAYYRGVNGLVLGATVGYRAPLNGTVVAFEYTRTDIDAANFNITANGLTIATLASSALSGGSNTMDADFAAGDVLAVQNAAGGSVTSNVAAWFRVKWRA